MRRTRARAALVAILAAVPSILACGRDGSRIEALRASVPDKARKEALARVEAIYAKAKYHEGSLVKVAEMIAVSGSNLGALVYSADLISRVGFHTLTILGVAEAASRARSELPEFRDLAELAVLRSGGHDELVATAEWASRIEPGADIAELRRRIAEMRDRAEWKTVDEAVSAVDEMQRDIARKMKESLSGSK
jgi:hypothetical protein